LQLLSPSGCDRVISIVQQRGAHGVKRIVANIAAPRPETARAFYGDVLGLEAVMDQGWIMTFAAPPVLTGPQISFAREGGSGTPVPDLSIEVDDLDEVLQRAKAAGFAIEYGPQQEPWGVRRFYVRDPFDRLLNILSHEQSIQARQLD
jgi:catechol 2,3-dioxygenase-like lactoylglutathione lyase family enzyme